ncbi:alpha/beta hydrolase family protein [Nonomuraea endophytica]|uniref:Dipeptidyl aminopeptidase/acylaminoacyl peptidase n=1 Tax=Nonomuraea endophytica TaxID=714136 RepID=A0A7W7ZZU3_9ACTN|nr:prolyl oligopeptidase family serine peptidase [Nonomuraea endophytica]MBB5076444.1 dipeptidyl aminopeptidase/acylaminoacyl peptidase [Nonomuraea endophytica]
MNGAARRWFGAEPAVNLALSPDGRAVSWQSEQKPGLFVWRPEHGVRRLRPGRIVDHAWLPGSRALVAVVAGRTEQVIVLDEAAGRTADVTPEGLAGVHVVDRDQPRRGSLLLGGVGADGRAAWHVLSSPGGPARRVAAPGAAGRLFSDAGDRPCAATARAEDGSLVVYAAEADAWHEVWRSRPPGSLVTHPVDVTADGLGLYLSGPCRDGFLGVRLLDLRTGKTRTVLEDGEHDLDVVLHPATRIPQLALVSGARQGLRPLDAELAADLSVLTSRHPGELEIVGLTRDNTVWLVQADDGESAPRHLLWNRGDGTAHPLTARRPGLMRRANRRALAPTAAVTVPARDGLTLDGYLVTPAVGAPPYPSVLLVHGGPWSRDVWGLSPQAQWLAELGYASLRVNFRGSEGYGTRFLDLGRASWGGGMQDDLEDTLRWAVSEGHVDPDRVAVMGQSYGGYAALMAATARPKAFALAVAICAPTDLVAFMRYVKRSSHHERAHFLHRVGDPDDDARRLRAQSPLTHAAGCHTPVLLVHGRDDPLVPYTQATTMADALAEHRRPHHCLVLSGEGHGITSPANRVRLARVVGRQLAYHLAGRPT